MSQSERQPLLEHPIDNRHPSSRLRAIASNLIRALVAYLVFRWLQNLSRVLLPKHPAADLSDASQKIIHNAWPANQSAELWIYFSHQPIQIDFKEQELKLHKTSIVYGKHDEQQPFSLSLNTTIGADMIRRPYFAHIYLCKVGSSPWDYEGAQGNIYRRIDLIKWMPRPAATANLLDNRVSPNPPHKDSSSEHVRYWYPELNISLIQEAMPLDRTSISPNLRQYIQLVPGQDQYLPIVYLNEFWQVKHRRILLDEASLAKEQSLPMQINFSPMSMFKLQLLTNFDQSLQANERLFGEDSEEVDKLKQMFVEANPYLLLVTILASLLHSAFDFLAFKNDIQFWKEKDKNLAGLSTRSVLVNAGFQFIIFLYLLDQETSWLVLASVGVGTLIEFWKIGKVLQINLNWSAGHLLPSLSITDRTTYVGSATKKYDSIAMKYLGIMTVPLLFAYSVYSLIYKEHKGWYSWLIGTLVGFVYTFGFISMTPQLFINYKMKSVAHMPWRVFIYKALNTFIDDLFAFIIKMPTMHRIACFRDDLIFIIYLYQRWIYPVDMSRINEFGQSFSVEDNSKPASENSTIDSRPDVKADQENSRPLRRRQNQSKKNTTNL